MNRIAHVFGCFGPALSFLQRGRVAVPLLLYFLLQLCLIALYVLSGAKAAGFWSLLKPSLDADLIAHYPEHLFLMGSILGRLDIPLEVLVLALAQGATVLLVAAASKRSPLGWRESLATAARRYVHLVFVAAVAAVALFVFFRYPQALLVGIAGAALGIAASLLIGVVFLSFLLYAIPFILLEGRSAPDAIRRSFGFAGRHFIESILLVIVPFLLTVPTLLLSMNPEAIAFQISPEFLIHVQIAGEAIQFVATYVLMGGLTVFFLQTRTAQEGS